MTYPPSDPFSKDPNSEPSGEQSPYGQQPQYGAPQQPGQQPYGAPQYGAPQAPQYPSDPQFGAPQYPTAPMYQAGPPMFMAPPKNSLGVWSMWLGIAGLVCLGVFAGIPALILGLQSKKANAQGLANNPGQATAGIILGSIAIAWTLFAIVAYVAN